MIFQDLPPSLSFFSSSLRRQGGLGLISWLLMIPAVLAALLVLAIGFYEGRKSYWDYKVREMCERDGGVTVYKKVRISTAEITRGVLPMTADGRLGFTIKQLAHPEAPVYADEQLANLRDGNPRVIRSESVIVLRADQSIVARWVFYSRVGGDFPTGLSEGTGFVCPDLQRMASDLHDKLYIVEGGPK